MINTVLEIQTGSHLYGTATEKSDRDFSGVFIAPEEYYFGLKDIDEVDLSIVSKLESGKNDSDAVDRKFYELRNFLKLAMNNNPNIIEHLFVNKENIVSINYYGEELLKNAHLFPNKSAYKKFLGYASSQKHKMIIKEQNYTELSDALQFFEHQMPHNSLKLLVEYREELVKAEIGSEKEHHFLIGDLNFLKSATTKKVYSMLKDRMSKISNRYELVTKYGYDTKFASHLIRLLIEGYDLLMYGDLSFPLQSKDLILSIKSGAYTVNEIMKMSEYYEGELTAAFGVSTLPESPDFEKINKLAIRLGKMNICIGNDI